MAKQNYSAVPVEAITRSVEAVLKSGDIEKLTKIAYEFLMQSPGFIAHYNLYGFRDNYRNVDDLVTDILRSCYSGGEPDMLNEAKRYKEDEWFTNEYGKAYCQSKAKAYIEIVNLARTYQGKTKDQLSDKVADRLRLLKACVDKAQGDPVYAEKLVRSLGIL